MNNNNVHDNNNRKKKTAPRRSQRVLAVPNADCPYDQCPAGRGNCQADEAHTCFGEPRCTNVSTTTLEQCDKAEVADGNCTSHFKKNIVAPLKVAAKQDPAFKEELENARQKLRNAQAKKRFEDLEKQKRMALEHQQELLERRGLHAEDFSYKKRVEREEDYEPSAVPMLSDRLRKRARANHDEDGDVNMQDVRGAECPACDQPLDDSTPNITCMHCRLPVHVQCLGVHHKTCK